MTQKRKCPSTGSKIRSRSRPAVRMPALAAACLTMAAAPVQAVQITANYTGASGGQYGTASNWDIGQVPLNNATNTFIVQIGINRSVNYQLTTPRSIDQLELDAGSPFSLLGTSLTQPTALTVNGRALIASSISASNASFTALGSGTSILGRAVALGANSGAVLSIAATGTYNARGLPNATVIGVSGSGSRIELPNLSTFDVGQDTGYSNFINVRDQAVLSMPALTTLVAPLANASLAFTVAGGSQVDLSALQTISGPSLDTGSTTFSVDASTMTLGALQKVNRTTFSLGNASAATLASAPGGADITNSLFYASAGSRLNAAALVGTLADRGLPNQTIIASAGLGTVIDLSGLSQIDVGSGSGYPFFVSVTDRSVLKLSGVQTLVAPASNNALTFNVNSGASLDLSSLRFVSGPLVNTGTTSFNLDAATVTLGPLQKANQLNLSLQNASLLTAGGYAGVVELTDSLFYASSGSRLNAAGLAGTLVDRGLPNQTIIAAAGTGTVIDLSGLTSIDVGNASGYSNFIGVSDRAALKLSRVTSLIAPASTQSLAFTVRNGGSLDLSALTSVQGLTLDTGTTSFTLDAGTAVLGPLQKGSRLIVNAQNGSAVTLGGFAGTADLTNSIFYASGASQVNAGTLVGTLNVRGLPNQTFIAASGTGTVLNLSGLKSLDYGGNSGYSAFVAASGNAALNLSGVTTIVAPASNNALAFTASAGGSIDLSNLQSITNAGGGYLSLGANTAGVIRLHGLAAGSALRINLADAGSRLDVNGSLSLLNGSTLFAGAGTRVSVSGSYSFQQTVEAEMNLDAATLVFNGSGLQTLEVGGARIATLVNGNAVTGNFAIGELDVGQAGAPTTVLLQDALNNGNRAANLSERLYLNGASGGNGLRILGGSVLALNGLELFTTENGAWVRINDRFTSGVTQIAYDQGYITLNVVPEPRTWALFALGLAALAGRRLRQQKTES